MRLRKESRRGRGDERVASQLLKRREAKQNVRIYKIGEGDQTSRWVHYLSNTVKGTKCAVKNNKALREREVRRVGRGLF